MGHSNRALPEFLMRKIESPTTFLTDLCGDPDITMEGTLGARLPHNILYTAERSREVGVGASKHDVKFASCQARLRCVGSKFHPNTEGGDLSWGRLL
jgi:hypothetical protein